MTLEICGKKLLPLQHSSQSRTNQPFSLPHFLLVHPNFFLSVENIEKNIPQGGFRKGVPKNIRWTKKS